MSDKFLVVIKLGAEMRQAQKQYFADRTPAKLAISKALEREFDQKAAECLNPQPDLLA